MALFAGGIICMLRSDYDGASQYFRVPPAWAALSDSVSYGGSNGVHKEAPLVQQVEIITGTERNGVGAKTKSAG
jgi:hypothetical protein